MWLTLFLFFSGGGLSVTMTTDISVVRWDQSLQQDIPQEIVEYDGGNSSSRLFERSRIKALAGKFTNDWPPWIRTLYIKCNERKRWNHSSTFGRGSRMALIWVYLFGFHKSCVLLCWRTKCSSFWWNEWRDCSGLYVVSHGLTNPNGSSAFPGRRTITSPKTCVDNFIAHSWPKVQLSLEIIFKAGLCFQ